MDGDKTMALVALGAFGGTGLLILALGISSILDQQEFLTRTVRVPAKVLRIEQRTTTTGTGSDQRTSISDCAILEFTTGTGETRQAEYSYGVLEASFEAGDTAHIYYDVKDPETVLVDGFAALWLGYLVILAMGLVFVAAGVFAYRMLSSS